MAGKLGELERAVMEVLWDRAEHDLACTTVMTVLDRLAKKGFVRRERSCTLSLRLDLA